MADPVLSLIEQEIEALLASLSVATGYRLNWAPVNFEDRALEDNSTYNCFACVYFESEENHDDVNTCHASAYSNKAIYTIECRVPLTSESTKPKFDARKQLYLAQEDIKKAFGDAQTMNSVYASNVQYTDSELIPDTLGTGDRFTPIYLKVYLDVWYFQDRIDPSIITS
jgi:hypothetical protein